MKEKIIIVSSGHIGNPLSRIIKENLSQIENVTVVSPFENNIIQITNPYKHIEIPIIQPLPQTRKERRARERKNKKSHR